MKLLRNLKDYNKTLSEIKNNSIKRELLKRDLYFVLILILISVVGILSAVDIKYIPYFLAFFSISIIILFYTLVKISKKKPPELTIEEEDNLIILINFLKISKTIDAEIISIICNIFQAYPKEVVINLYNEYTYKSRNFDTIFERISNRISKTRFFLLYSLLDISSKDSLLTIEEEKYINTIRKKINIPISSYNYIKNIYLNKGLKEERKIIEEQNRKKAAESFTKSFIPYNAYKILGVSPSITKTQLKKIYRTLAKKYHPDKFYGQNEEIIQKAEDKFQEILEAYEIINKFKDFN